jgi:hypothetical protein
MADDRERFRELTNYGVIPAPAGAGAVVIHAEEEGDCRVVLNVFRPADKAHKIAIVTLSRCLQSVFGYPNDEAYRHDPRGEAGDQPGYGFYEVLSSTWPQRLIAYNRHAFPDSTPGHYSGYRHFFRAATMHLASFSPTISLSRSLTTTMKQRSGKRSRGRVECPPAGDQQRHVRMAGGLRACILMGRERLENRSDWLSLARGEPDGSDADACQLRRHRRRPVAARLLRTAG